MPEWIGKTIGRVRIEKRLAVGGMAEVYLGSHLTLERPVAIKLLHSYIIEQDPFLLERFHREAKVVAGLRHPNIVQIFDFDITDGHPYIIVEYLKGPTLATYLRHLHQRKNRVPSHQVARLLKGLTGALDYAHGQGVIHRDIKPGNILLHNKTDDIPLDKPLSNEVEAILTDFEMIRIIQGTSQTASGMISGTLAYMSPEQARGDQTDHRTDIYSLGIVLYEMLAGRVPFEADDMATVLHMQIHTTPPPIPGIPPEVQAVVDRALLKNPDDRYQTSSEMAIDYYLSIGMNRQADAIREPYPASAVPPQMPQPASAVPSQKPQPAIKPEPKPAKKLSLSISFPKLVSKHFSSKFLVHFYFPLNRLSIQKTLENELGSKNVSEYIYVSDLIPGKRIKVNLTCLDIDFTAPIIRTLNETTQFLFLGKPKNNCEPNTHQVLLEITDVKTNEQLQSLFFPVKVVDLVLGYISRPLLSNVSTAILGISSVAMFALTFIGQIDQTLGLTSGTTVGIIASIVYTRFVGSYQSQRRDAFRT